VNTVSHSGTVNLGSDGILALTVGPSNGWPSAAYVGGFELLLTAVAPASAASSPGTSTTTTTATTQSSTGSGSTVNTVSSTGTANRSGNATNVPLLTAIWGGSTDPEASTSTSTSTSGGKINSPAPAANQGVTIGGTVGGVVAALLVGIIIWVIYRRRSRRTETQQKSAEGTFDNDYIHPFPNTASENEQDPGMGASARDSSENTPSIFNPNIPDTPPPAMSYFSPPSYVLSPSPPAYDSLSVAE